MKSLSTVDSPSSSITLLLLIAVALPLSVAAQSVDRTDGYLLPAAAPNRVVGPGDHPNVLLIVVDDLNVALGSYLESARRPQYASAKTPNLDRLAAEGIRFERAYVQNPLCHPSRTSFLSGLRPASTGIHDNSAGPRAQIGDALRMLPEHFHDHGYFTARVGKIAHNTHEHAVSWDVSKFALSREPAARFHFPGYLPPIDLSRVRDDTWKMAGADRGLSRNEILAAVGRRGGLPLSWRATTESPRMTPDGTTATRIVQLLAENRDKPFFIAAGFHKPHQPWVGPAAFFEQHPTEQIELPTSPADGLENIPAPASQVRTDDLELTEIQKKQAVAAYHAMVTMTDSYVGQLLDALELLELTSSTIVVFTSDHGFQLNEHGGLWRKSVQFEESTRVPLIVRLPDGRSAGRVVRGLVELVDLYPTLVELATLPAPRHELEGLSFGPLLENPDLAWKSAVFSESRREGFHGRTLREERYRYTEWTPLPETEGDTVRELYDLLEDPYERRNLVPGGSHDEVIADLSRRLAAGWRMALPRA